MGWRGVAYRGVRPLLFQIEPERIHRLTIDALRFAGESRAGRLAAEILAGDRVDDSQPAEVAGVRFRNRIGIGAGWDKDGKALRGWAALGAGFAEVGTVTPRPQSGNPTPRLFRLPADNALINRLGFNSVGALDVARRVMLARRYLPEGFVVGVNIGPNRDTPADEVLGDFLFAHRLLAPVADFLVVNVSSPNTPGLRELQDAARLGTLARAAAEAGDVANAPRPLFVKLAPDLGESERASLLTALCEMPVAGVVLSNSTLERDGLRSPPALVAEAGGLSGAPLFERTRAIVAAARQTVGQRLAIIASGGIGSAEQALAIRQAGADLLELWTGLVYAGPGLLGEARTAIRRSDG